MTLSIEIKHFLGRTNTLITGNSPLLISLYVKATFRQRNLQPRIATSPEIEQYSLQSKCQLPAGFKARHTVYASTELPSQREWSTPQRGIQAFEHTNMWKYGIAPACRLQIWSVLARPKTSWLEL